MAATKTDTGMADELRNSCQKATAEVRSATGLEHLCINSRIARTPGGDVLCADVTGVNRDELLRYAMRCLEQNVQSTLPDNVHVYVINPRPSYDG